MKLAVGEIIEVHGWVMMQNLESGERYRVNRIGKNGNRDVYFFTKPKGTKEIIGHFVSNVDLWVKDSDSNNRIQVIK